MCGERETRRQKLETRSEKQSQSPSDEVGARAKQRHPLPSYGGQTRNKGPRIPIRSGQVGHPPGTLKPKIDKRRDTECAEWARTREIHRMPKPHAMEKSTSYPQADPFAGAKGKEDSACFVRNDGGERFAERLPRQSGDWRSRVRGIARGQRGRGGQRILTARAARRATMVSEIKDWSIMPSLAQRERTAVSVGEKAVLVLKARKR